MASGTNPRVYTISSETANGSVNSDMLTAEIEGDGAITTALSHIDTASGQAFIYFDGDLSGAEQTALDAVVAAHQGVATTFAVKVTASNEESTNSTTTPADKLNSSVSALKSGSYLITWHCEIKTDTADTSGVRATLLLASTERSEDNWAKTQWHVFSGVAVQTFADGDTPQLQLQFARIGAAATVSIRRAIATLSFLG